MIADLVKANRVLKPPQNHGVFYYLLDFTGKLFFMIDQFEQIHCRNSSRVGMFHLGKCFEYRFYHVDINGRHIKTIVEIKEEISRNEFFSQYALGTLEGTFIAARDIIYLCKYLNILKKL